MNRRQKTFFVVSAVIAFFAAFVTANSPTAYTPLYMVRMEKISSEMNFSPIGMNGFTYNTEKGYNLNYMVGGHCGAVPLITGSAYTCETCDETCSTCYGTCEGTTCEGTCYSTCPVTCATCEPTCEQNTCWNTCGKTCPTSYLICPTYRECP